MSTTGHGHDRIICPRPQVRETGDWPEVASPRLGMHMIAQTGTPYPLVHPASGERNPIAIGAHPLPERRFSKDNFVLPATV